MPISIVYPKGIARDGRLAAVAVRLRLVRLRDVRHASTAGASACSTAGSPFAIAHVRGGNEMGEAWHDDGMLMKKKNTFFDFIDCAEFLVREKWTSPERLLIEGGSAGGLLMGAVTNERPDLFRAVHAAVPFVDVMNTMMDASLPLTVGEYLEWGNPNEKAAFDYMLSYSPYDNLARKAYPAILVTTSYNDSQVMYWEPAKYVAKLRTLKTDREPARAQDEDAAGRPRRRERPLRRAQGPRLRGRLDAEAGGDHEVARRASDAGTSGRGERMRVRVLALAAGVVAIGGDAAAFHEQGVANCNGCHVTHGGENGRGVLVGPSADGGLLIAESPSDVCLVCHAAAGSARCSAPTPWSRRRRPGRGTSPSSRRTT